MKRARLATAGRDPLPGVRRHDNHDNARRRYVSTMKAKLDAFVVEEKAREAAELDAIGEQLRAATLEDRPVFR